MAIFNSVDKKFYCECGCGEQIPFYNKFRVGHWARTPEGRGRLARSMVENCHDPEARKKLSESKKRYWNSLSPKEFWERMEDSVCSEAAKKAAAETNRTLEVRERNSRSNKAFWDSLTPEERGTRLENSLLSESCRRAGVEANKDPEVQARRGRAISRAFDMKTPEEYRLFCESISKGKEGEQWDEERRRRKGKAVREFWAGLSSEEQEERMKNSVLSETSKAAATEAKGTSEFREKRSRIQSRVGVAVWAAYSPEEKAERIRNSLGSAQPPQSPTKPEIQLWKFLDQFYPGFFVPDWIERADIGGRHPDFWSRDGYKLVIESNGTFWHSPEYFDRPTEEEQVAHYKRYGYACLVVWANSADDVIYEWPELARRVREVLAGTKGGE